MKYYLSFFITFFICISSVSAQNRLDSLLMERQNYYQNLIWRMDPKLLNNKDIAYSVNAMSSIDSMISEEVHRIDSIDMLGEKMSPLIGITLEKLRAKKDKAQSYFYISLTFLAFLIGLSIYLTEKLGKQNKTITFLKADIAEVNSNNAKISEEKIKFHREFNIKIKSLEDKLISSIDENERLASSQNNFNTDDQVLENGFLKEAIRMLEMQKQEMLEQIEILKDNQQSKKDKITAAEVEYMKIEFTKRIEYLENALKTKEIMESVMVNRNKDIEDHFKEMESHVNQLSEELEEEKVYNEQLLKKITFFEDEIAEKELELKTLWSRISKQVNTKPQLKVEKIEDTETDMLKTLEKLNRLKQAEILSDSEFNTLKDKIISQY